MSLLLLLAAASSATQPRTAVDAERAFARAAVEEGNWTAFRRFAAPDAVMFVPQPTNAQAFLKPLKDPPQPIRWSPTASFVSCDGKWAANTGEWRQPDGSVGYFSTVWHHQPDGEWRWLVDGGDALPTPRAPVAEPVVRKAKCGGAGRSAPTANAPNSGGGASGDATLRWRWQVQPDGARVFQVELWNGHGYDKVIDDQIAAPTKP